MTAKKRTDPTLGGAIGSYAKNTTSRPSYRETQAGPIRNQVSKPKAIGVVKIKNSVNSPS